MFYQKPKTPLFELNTNQSDLKEAIREELKRFYDCI